MAFVPLYLFDLSKPFILPLVPEAQGCRRCPELIRSQIAAGLSPSCVPSSAIILVLIPTSASVHTIFFFFHLNFHKTIPFDYLTLVTIIVFRAGVGSSS